MKYLFINSVAGFGSTGRIAADKCRELIRQGHTCVLAYGRDKANCDDIPTVAIGGRRDYRLHGLESRVLDDQGFGSRKATREFLAWAQEYDPDVIWLHNIHGYYLNIELLFSWLKTCGKPIFWTLHDCWAFTGHCAYFDFAGCDKWREGCHHCPQKKSYPASFLLDNSRRNWRKKRELFTGVPNLTLVTPSQWLAGLVKESFLQEYPVMVVYNTIDRDVFRPTPGDFRQRYGLGDKRILLGVASVWERRKGLRDFVVLAGLLPKNWRIVLVGVPENLKRRLPKAILALPRTNSATELAEIYTAADVFANPTYEENYPTVNLEAHACGTRVVSYDAGGSGETLGEGDALVPKGDLKAMLAEILREDTK